LLKENQNQDPSRQIIDETNQHRLNVTLGFYPYKKNLMPTHAEGHDKHHLETTYHKDFTNHNPEFANQKSQKAVSFMF
jgi:hypothetical protein